MNSKILALFQYLSDTIQLILKKNESVIHAKFSEEKTGF